MTTSTLLDPHVAQLLELVSRTDFPSRKEYLNLACRLIECNECSTLLWIYDEGRNEYLLDRAITPYCSEDDLPELFRCRNVTASDGNINKRFDREIDLHNFPDIQEWFEAQPTALEEYHFPLVASSSSANKKLGYLQLLTPKVLDETQLTIMRFVADNLSRIIVRQRENRLLDALEQLNSNIDLRRPISEWFRIAAEVLRKATFAEICLVFQQGRDLSFHAVAASPAQLPLERFSASANSLTRRMAETCMPVVRLRDFRDRNERLAYFKTDAYDHELAGEITKQVGEDFRARMAAPVVVSGHAFAVIKLVNKRKNLARQFSETDERILDAVRSFLSGIIPSVETIRSMEQISETSLPRSLDNGKDRAALFELIDERIPGVVGSALFAYLGNPNSAPLVVRSFDAAASCEKLEIPQVPIGSPEAPEHWKPGEVSEIPNGGTNAKRWLYLAEIPGLDRKSAFFAVLLMRNYLSDYEKQVLSFFSKELSQIIRSDESASHLIQVRHAIRSGLEGLNHVYVATQCFRQVRKAGFKASDFRKGQLRKSLEWGQFFLRKTQVLINESRFLINEVTPESLRLSQHSVSALVRGVIRSIRYSAESREVEIYLDQTAAQQSLDEVNLDRGLMEIVVFNLVDNAVKYSHRGRDVRIKLFIETGNWGMVVSNIGVFIKPEDRDDIFHIFERRPTGQAAYMRPGTGLGLPVAKQIVEAHGGTIEVESKLLPSRQHEEPAALTLFTLKIPRRISKKDNE